MVPDERLRLILICCHPAVAVEARAALTLRMVCGLSTAEVARAFLTPEAPLAQRLVRAKRKIADAGVPFGLPDRAAWPERMEPVLSTLELAYAFAYGDAAGAGPHAAFAGEMLGLTGLLARLAPEPEVLAFAALVRLAEARRPARLDEAGAMVPLTEQDVSLWRADLLAEGERMLAQAARAPGAPGPRALQAAIHAAHASRRRSGETPWRAIASLYDALMQVRPSPVTAVNRAVAVGEARGAAAGLEALEAVCRPDLCAWLPWRAAQAHLLAAAGRSAEAAAAYDAALALEPPAAERLFLEARRRALGAAITLPASPSESR